MRKNYSLNVSIMKGFDGAWKVNLRLYFAKEIVVITLKLNNCHQFEVFVLVVTYLSVDGCIPML